MNQENQIKGSLYGLMWGDVLGCPVETWKEHDSTRIASFADLLVSRDSPTETMKTFVANEALLTKKEKDFIRNQR